MNNNGEEKMDCEFINSKTVLGVLLVALTILIFGNDLLSIANTMQFYCVSLSYALALIMYGISYFEDLMYEYLDKYAIIMGTLIVCMIF